MSPQPLTEDQIDDLLLSARYGDLDDLRTALTDLSTARATTPFIVLHTTLDPESKNTPLHYAAANGHNDVVTYLLSLLPTASTASSAAQSATTEASSTDAVTASALTQQPPPSSSTSQPPTAPHTSAAPLLNARNSAGNTPLHWAALNGHLEIVKALVQAGADIGVQNAAGRSAVGEAEVAAMGEGETAGRVGEVVVWLLGVWGGVEEGVSGKQEEVNGVGEQNGEGEQVVNGTGEGAAR